MSEKNKQNVPPSNDRPATRDDVINAVCVIIIAH